VPFHPPPGAAVGVLARLFDQAPAQERAEGECEQDDDERAAEELGQRELPAEDERHDDPQLDDEVGRSELERHRGGEVRPLAEQRARERDGRVGARGRRGAEADRDTDRSRRVIRQQAPDLGLGDGRLDDGRERESEDQRPQDLPEHAERERERIDDRHETAVSRRYCRERR